MGKDLSGCGLCLAGKRTHTPRHPPSFFNHLRYLIPCRLPPICRKPHTTWVRKENILLISFSLKGPRSGERLMRAEEKSNSFFSPWSGICFWTLDFSLWVLGWTNPIAEMNVWCLRGLASDPLGVEGRDTSCLPIYRWASFALDTEAAEVWGSRSLGISLAHQESVGSGWKRKDWAL